MTRYMSAEGMQNIDAIRAMAEADRTDAQKQLLALADQLRNAQGVGTAQTAANKLTTHVNALRTLSAAVGEDGSALMMAKKYSEMLGVLDVKGSSETARENAQKVLDAQKALRDAIDAIDAIAGTKAAAVKARTNAMALHDTPGKDAVIAVLNSIIDDATKQVEAAQKVLDATGADSLKAYVAVVTKCPVSAAGCTGEQNPETAADRGKDVAEAIGQALFPMVADTAQDATTHDGTARRVSHYGTESALTGASPPAVGDRTFDDNDSTGMTWAEIVGGSLVDLRVVEGATGGVQTRAAKAMSVGGTKVSEWYASGSEPTAATIADGTEVTTGVTYKGIGSLLVCTGTCSVEEATNAADRTLKGDWYITPLVANAMTIYVRRADDSTTTNVDESQLYEADTMYARWGHWIAADTTDSTLTRIHTYATSAGNTGTLGLGVATGSTSATETAVYTGSAAGMSLHKTFDGQGNVDKLYSGAFQADVSLTARFGASPMLSGTINNFRGGAHTDPTWSVALQEVALEAAGNFAADAGNNKAKGSGQAGDWTTQAYGPAVPADGNPAEYRPTGFFGGFNAHFTDGHAAGAYATRKQ